MRRLLIPISILVAVLVGLVAAGGTLPTTAQPSTARPEREGCAGAWQVASASPGRPLHIITFAADGTLMDVGPPVQPAAPEAANDLVFSSAGPGVWVRTGEHSCTFTFVRMAADERGTNLGTTTVRGMQELSADGQAFTSTVTITIADATGKVVRTLSGTAEGTRMHVAPAMAGTPAP